MYYYLFKLLFSKIFGLKLKKEDIIVREHLIDKTFKFPEIAYLDFWIIPKYYFTLVNLPCKSNLRLRHEKLIIDSSKDSKKTREKYLNYFLGHSMDSFEFLSYYDLLFYRTKFEKIIYLLISSLAVPFLFISALFLSNKPSIALFLEYPLVIKNLKQALNSKEVKSVYYFGMYERESNLLTKILMVNKIKVLKFTSLAPLSLWNKHILTDELYVNHYYQIEELEFNKESVQIDTIHLLGPEKYHEYQKTYIDRPIPPLNTLGFYSTASWVRKAMGHIDQGIDNLKGERKVLKMMRSFKKRNPNVNLIVFLHPKEKHPNYINEAKKYYDQYLGKSSYELADVNKQTSEMFAIVDLGVAFNTSIMYERLYLGYKGLLMLESSSFPILNSCLDKISCDSGEEFEQKVLFSLNLSSEEFFRKFNLTKLVGNISKMGRLE